MILRDSPGVGIPRLTLTSSLTPMLAVGFAFDQCDDNIGMVIRSDPMQQCLIK